MGVNYYTHQVLQLLDSRHKWTTQGAQVYCISVRLLRAADPSGLWPKLWAAGPIRRSHVGTVSQFGEDGMHPLSSSACDLDGFKTQPGRLHARHLCLGRTSCDVCPSPF